MPSVSSKVRRANQLSSTDLSAMILAHHCELPAKFQLEVLAATELPDNAKSWIWNIFETNMHDIYVSSTFDWDPPEKKEELFDPASRFILVWDHTTLDGRQLSAYTMFRFDMEEGERVVYCYELQVAASARRQKLGQHLMQLMTTLARATGMEKVMLTVQKSNTNARQFYTSIGFLLDPVSPDFEEDVAEKDDRSAEQGYSILSRTLT